MNPSMYLGLPTIWGRSRKDTLGYLKERIWDKLHSWRNHLLNQAGKEVLIKSVVTALPTYVMSAFKLLTSRCNEVNSMIARFWWGVINGDRKVHWKRWEIMTPGKKDDDFGLRELYAFNSAMLATMASWNMTEPNTLWVKVTKSLYFPSTDFFHAVKGGTTSWGWSSLLAGRDVLM